MRKVTIVVSMLDGTGDSVTRAAKEVCAILERHPGATTTWMQSSASTTGNDGQPWAEHVISCAVEWEEDARSAYAADEASGVAAKTKRAK